MPSEFELIRKYFTRPTSRTILGVGDDAALIKVAAGKELAVSTDMLLAGRHFFHEDDPFRLGGKALAVNLSDMAAMGATPRWATLSIALPQVDAKWLKAFSAGLFSMSDKYGVDLIGGDTTRGPLAISIQIMGEVEKGKALRRAGADPDDEIWVSGNLGDAALALSHLQHRITLTPYDVAACLPALHSPEPRVELGEHLLGLATSAIDISDGLLADMGHILEASGVGADIEYSKLPVSETLAKYLEDEVARDCLLSGGDDYELCFTAPADLHDKLRRLSKRQKINLTCIGRIVNRKGLRVRDDGGRVMSFKNKGFDHFSG